MITLRAARMFAGALAVYTAVAEVGFSQDQAKPVEIADEPRAIDPATLMPEKLAAKATVEFTEASLKDVVKWLQEEQNLGVLIDEQDIASDGVSLIEPISDRLNDEPLYLLLDRLSHYGLSWYFEDDVLHITSISKAEERQNTVPYNVGDLIDAGYDASRLLHAIQEGTTGEWEEAEGVGGAIILLGDVIFVRQPARIHREVAGLLAALRKPARRTFTLDAPQHAAIREKLQQRVSIDLQDAPLGNAVKLLTQQTGIDIRLDGRAMRERRVRERTPVSLKLSDQKLTVVLQALVAEWGFKALPEDGVLWITSPDNAQKVRLTAVYDVRDLCRDDAESNALAHAILGQTRSEWSEHEGVGGHLAFARPGILVVLQSEAGHEEVVQLLENYRTALRASKPRPRKLDDPKEILTLYYRLPTAIAEDLQRQLPILVKPETWKTETQPDAAGTIIKVASKAEFLDPGRGNQVVDHSVLIVRQMREVHKEIGDLIQ
jgi:hypothetical protein